MAHRDTTPMLGIIGGAGVAATNLLQTKIEQAFTRAGAFRDAHHPQIWSFQATQVPSRSMFLEGKGETFVPQYQKIAQQLETAGANIIGMCCNTAHAEYQSIADSVHVPVVNIIEETLIRVAASSVKKIGLLASRGCIVSGVYQSWLSKLCADRELVIPGDVIQDQVTHGIVNVKNSARFMEITSPQRPAQLFAQAIQSLRDQGCDAIILGCTDIAVDFDAEQDFGVEIFDSLQIMAETLVDRLMALYPGNLNAIDFYNGLSSRITAPAETKNKSKNGSAIDISFILEHAPSRDSLLDLGSGTGLIINTLGDAFDHVVAVEKFPEFSRFIHPRANLKIINENLLEFKTSEQFSVVTVFACLNYFNFFEASQIYRTAWDALLPGGTLIVKHQMGVKETVMINQVSQELGQYYFSQYRALSDEMTMIRLAGFEALESFDIYPAEYNTHSNTHFYAIRAQKPLVHGGTPDVRPRAVTAKPNLVG